jgi:O-antigen ligase
MLTTARPDVTRATRWPLVHGAVALVLAWGALAFGSVYSWAFWPLAAAAAGCGAAGLLLPDSGPHVPRLASMALAWCFAIVAALVVLQLVPLPLDLALRLSPRLARVLSELDVAFAAGLTSRHALSIAPSATLTSLLLYLAFALLMFGVARLASLAGTRTIAWIVCALGVLLAVIGIVQRPLYTGRIYGFWAPMMESTRPFGPFVNPNHFAGWMLMALPVAFGLLCSAAARGMAGVKADWRSRIIWLSSREASQTILIGAAAVVMAVSLMLTMSRSGIGAFAVSVAITSWFALRRLPGGSKRVMVTAYLACILVIAVGCVGSETIAARFASANPGNINERLPIWRDTWAIVRDFWLTGTGLNTYGVATLLYQTAEPDVHLREAHNDYLQIAAEGGLLLAVPVACAIGILAVEVRRRFRRSHGSSYWIRLGAVTGLLAIALQSMVEFSLQMPGNAALVAVLGGIALHHPPAGRRLDHRDSAAVRA